LTVLPRAPNGDIEVTIGGEQIVFERLTKIVSLNRRSEMMLVLHDFVAE